MKCRVNPRIGWLAVMCVLAASFTWVDAQQRSGATVAIDTAFDQERRDGLIERAILSRGSDRHHG